MLLPGIRTRNQHSPHGMFAAPPEAAMPELIVAEILVQNRRKYPAGHEVFNGIVPIRCAVAFRIPLHPLPIAWIAVACLIDPSHKSDENKFERVENSPRRNFKFLPCRQRWNVEGVFQSEEVWHGPKNAIVGCAFLQLFRRLFLLGIWTVLLLRGEFDSRLQKLVYRSINLRQTNIRLLRSAWPGKQRHRSHGDPRNAESHTE